MIAIIDYGMGNLRSVQKALEKVGGETCITQDIRDILGAQKIVLPGVGAMQPAMKKLEQQGLITVIKETIDSGKPFLGICLGLQLLFETSNEGGEVKGLSILPGTVERFTASDTPSLSGGVSDAVLARDSIPRASGGPKGRPLTSLKVPHMGWNQIKVANNDCPLWRGIDDQANVYFCHSYYVKPTAPDITATTTDYGVTFTSSVYKDNIFGVQFHPEKSQTVGLKVLENFVRLA